MVRRISFCLTVLALVVSGEARASFHLATIAEVLTSYQGDANVQFVEILDPVGGQNLVGDTVLAAFDASGAHSGDLLVVPSDVSTASPTWLMATAAFETATGITPDFVIPPGLPTAGGMACWGAPGAVAPDPGSWDHTNPENYVDCVAYGTYSGPVFNVAGSPTRLDGQGHSLVHTGVGGSSLRDWECTESITPQANDGVPNQLAQDVACPPTRVFTVDAPVTFSGPGDGGTISGTIHAATPSEADIENAVCIFDTCLSPFDGFFYQVTLDPGSADLYSVNAVLANVFEDVKGGHLEDFNAGTRAPMGIIIGGASERVTFDDDNQGNQLQAGETSDVLMLHFPYSVIASAQPTTADFELSRYAVSTEDFLADRTATVVSEPAEAPSYAAVLLALIALARRRGRQQA